MLVGYPGTHPFTLWVSGFTFADGCAWPTPLEDDGSGNRSAANIFAGLEGLTDRTNTLAARAINIVDGGTYTFVSAVSLDNGWTFTNACAIAVGARLNVFGAAHIGSGAGGLGTLYVGGALGPGHVLVGTDSEITLQGTSGHNAKIHVPTYGEVDIESGGALNTLAGSTANLGGQTTRTGAETLSGTGAFTNKRTITIAAAPTATINGADADIFNLPATLSAPMTITIATNATAAHHRFVIRTTSNNMGFDVSVQNAGGTRFIGKFYDAPGALSAEYQGAIEYFYSASGQPTVLFVNTGLESTMGPTSTLLASVN